MVEKMSNEKNDVKRLKLKWLWTLIIEITRRLKLIISVSVLVKRLSIMSMLDLTISRTIFIKFDKIWLKI